MSKNKIFITGGAGYIGSHTCIELLNAGYDCVVYDNLCNSNIEAIKRVERIASKKITFIKGDLRDKEALHQAMQGCTAVIHFAGLKAVGESVKEPLAYYETNVNGSLCLFQVMESLGVYSIVFSSSATVYGDPLQLPLTEDHRCIPTNPYGDTKLVIETMLRALYGSNSNWNIAMLRYFNPVGAHKSGLIGEDPHGMPNNLMPFISQVAVGKRKELAIFGNDYDTPDGTGVRDYIHVVDLAKGHLKALENLANIGCESINLGTGNGHSVLDVVNTFEKVSQKKVPYTIQPRRAGDVASCYADIKKAKTLLGWTAQFDLQEMCKDSFTWQSKNPNGYH